VGRFTLAEERSTGRGAHDSRVGPHLGQGCEIEALEQERSRSAACRPWPPEDDSRRSVELRERDGECGGEDRDRDKRPAHAT
jgi:hypothetical protein